jgi:hypothetical protein
MIAEDLMSELKLRPPRPRIFEESLVSRIKFVGKFYG